MSTLRNSFELLRMLRAVCKTDTDQLKATVDAMEQTLKQPGGGLQYNNGILSVKNGNGLAVNSSTNALEVPIGNNLRYTSQGLDVPNADEVTAGAVKLTHKVSNRTDGEWAVTADGVYSYCPAKGMVPEMPPSGSYLNVDGIPYATMNKGILKKLKNKQICVYSHIRIEATITPDEDTNLKSVQIANNLTNLYLPVVAHYGYSRDNATYNPYIVSISPSGVAFASDVIKAGSTRYLCVEMPVGIYPFIDN